MNTDLVMAVFAFVFLGLWAAESVKRSLVTAKYEQEREWRHEDAAKVELSRKKFELANRMLWIVVREWTPPIEVPEKAEINNPYTDMPY